MVHFTLLGKLVSYDADGDGDFDVEDAKVLLGKCSDFQWHFYQIMFCMTDFGSLLCSFELNQTGACAWYFHNFVQTTYHFGEEVMRDYCLIAWVCKLDKLASITFKAKSCCKEIK